jgi:hypothetical protein
MRIRLGNVVLSLLKEKNRGDSRKGGTGNPGHELSLADIKSINDAYVKYISGLSAAELQSRTAEVTVNNINTPDGLSRAKQVLEEYGIIIIPSVLGADVCQRVQQRVESLYGKYSAYGQSEYEEERFLYQAGSGKLKGYHQLSNHTKTVFYVRKGQDEGMVDIFNCDIAFPEEFREVRKSFETEEILYLLAYKSIKPKNLNTYINRGIRQTRGFHVDSYSEQIKAFIYMTDVKDLGDGPYTFVKKSHKESPYRRANRKLGEGMDPGTEAPVLDPSAITPVLAARGSMIISDQSGVHRGWPQLESGKRLVAVMNYK